MFKADIPLAERSAWEDWITRDRAEIARLSAEITKAEGQIDSIVYALFDLIPDEIALLEARSPRFSGSGFRSSQALYTFRISCHFKPLFL